MQLYQYWIKKNNPWFLTKIWNFEIINDNDTPTSQLLLSCWAQDLMFDG